MHRSWRAEGRRQTRTTLPGLDLAKCLLCQSEKKQLKNRRLLEKPLRCTLDSAARTLINAARSRSDVRVLLKIENSDLHAKDILYHSTCYRNYTSPRELELLLQKELDTEDRRSPHQVAFEKLAEDVENAIKTQPSTGMSMSELFKGELKWKKIYPDHCCFGCT